MNNVVKEISSRLKAARKAGGYGSACSFAIKHNIKQTTYNQHESGKRQIKADVLNFYADVLGIDIAWLLTGKQETILNEKAGSLSLSEHESLKSVDCIDGLSVNVSIDVDLLSDVFEKVTTVMKSKNISITVRDLTKTCVDIYECLLPHKISKKLKADLLDSLINRVIIRFFVKKKNVA